MFMKKIVFFILYVFLLSACSSGTSPIHRSLVPVYLDDRLTISERIDDIIPRLTLEEKVALCHAQSKFSSPGVQRLGIPELWMNDGPFGVRSEVLYNSWTKAENTNDSCTAFPALAALAASWDTALAKRYGSALSEEANYREKDVQLAPGVNIVRTPLNGRNFEYMGEDPFLVSRLTVSYIKAIQENGIAVCVKHFAMNNQESERMTVNVEASERALREIYLPAFKAAVVEAGAWSVMGAYNKFRGQHCCHNSYLINDILKGEWGFDGAVISDWSGTKNAYEAAMNGLDIEMGTMKPYKEYYMADSLLYLVRSGKVPESVVDEKVRRVLRLNLRTAMNRNRPWGSFNTVEHTDLAREVAEKGIVLLKNEQGLLPIECGKYKRVAVIGENAIRKHSGNGGAAALKPRYEITPLEGLRERFGKDTEVVFSRGYCSYTPLPDGTINPPKYDNTVLARDAVELAKDSDLVIFVGGLNHDWMQDSEGYDRESFGLPYGQPELIERIMAVNSNVILVLVSGNAVDLRFAENVPAIVQAWYCGSESGNALAAVLSGDVNPSGKLPVSFPASIDDCGAHSFGQDAYPGIDGTVTYSEGVYVGYRWFSSKGIAPMFAFGHGLSYTDYEYCDANVDRSSYKQGDKVRLTYTIKNVGERDGEEISQVYVSKLNSSVDRPVKELKGFAKTLVRAGESKVINVELPVDEWSFWDETVGDWNLEKGMYEIQVAASSDDVRQVVVVEIE